MSKSQPMDARPKTAPVPGDDDLGFEVDDEEIDLNLPDWPDPAEANRASDTAVTLPARDTARSGARAVRADDLGPSDDVLDDDFDLPLPGPTTAAAKAAPARKAAAESKSEHDVGAKERSTASPVAKKATRAAQATRSTTAGGTKGTKATPAQAVPATAPSPAVPSPSPHQPTVAATPEWPVDPGYDVLPAGALSWGAGRGARSAGRDETATASAEVAGGGRERGAGRGAGVVGYGPLGRR